MCMRFDNMVSLCRRDRQSKFSTISSILHCHSHDIIEQQHRALDELDVYLDEINRSAVEEMLLEFARTFSRYQYIFISPQPPNNRSGVNVIEIK